MIKALRELLFDVETNMGNSRLAAEIADRITKILSTHGWHLLSECRINKGAK